MIKTILGIIIFSLWTTAAWAAATIVTQSQKKFDVDTVSLKIGDTIVFKNNDDFSHNIQIINSSGNIADLGLEKPDIDLPYEFSNAGHYKIHCAIHPKMEMTVIVQ